MQFLRFDRVPPLGTCLALLPLLALGSASWAGADDWQARIHGQYVSGSAQVLGDQELDEGVGLYLGVERRLGARWGVEVGIGRAEAEAEETTQLDFFGLSVRTDIVASLEWTPLAVAANYHLTPSRDFDFYVAPRVGFVFVDDFEVETRVDLDGGIIFPGLPILGGFPLLGPDFGPDGSQTVVLDIDDTWFYGLRLGFDRPFADGPWSFSAALTYDIVELEAEDGGVADLDPLSIGLGVAYRW